MDHFLKAFLKQKMFHYNIQTYLNIGKLYLPPNHFYCNLFFKSHYIATYHNWKLAVWVESQKSIPIEAVIDSPGSRDSGEQNDLNMKRNKGKVIDNPFT